MEATAIKNHTILLVDDDPMLSAMYSTKFKSAGYQVEVCSDGPMCLSKLKEGFNPDLVLLDMILPSMDGTELLDRMRKEGLGSKSKIIILSNQNQESEIAKAKNYNIDGYIVKASTIPSEVVAEIDKILQS